MKKNKFIIAIVLSQILGNTSYSFAFPSKIPISVTKFTNKSAHNPTDVNCFGWAWFSSDPGQALQERAIEVLQNDSRFEVLERETIHEINDEEVNLINSEKSDYKIEKGNFKKAKYTIVGAVKTLEFCNSKSEGSLDVGKLFGFGSLEVGLANQKSVVAVSLRLIDTNTGAVVSTGVGESNQSRTGVSLDTNIQNLDFKTKHVRDSALGKAIDEAIARGVSELTKSRNL